MIGRIAGTLLEKNPPHLLIDCHGIGYEVDVPMSTFYQLPEVGEPIVLLTQLIVREDAHLLYGFGTVQERSIFRALLKISGFGARIALAVLSGMSVADLSQAVAMQDVTRLICIPGIGKKTAARLLLELKGKLNHTHTQGSAASALSVSASISSQAMDVLNALLALGYSEQEALAAIKTLPTDMTLPDSIRLALKVLCKA